MRLRRGAREVAPRCARWALPSLMKSRGGCDMRVIRIAGSGLCVVAVAAGLARAQCGPQWLAGSGIPGVNGTVYTSVTWDPDGAGPLPVRLAVAGSFTVAGSVPASNIAIWDGFAWQPLGAGVDGGVYGLATLPTGGIVVAGSFTAAGGAPANHIAFWNGTAWFPLSSGMDGDGFTVLAGPGGVIAGGHFMEAGGVAARNIAQWNGSAWSALGGGVGDYTVVTLARLPSGEVVAAGNFYSAEGSPVGCIASWNGSTWSTFGTGLTVGFPITSVSTLAALSGGDLLAGGNFLQAGGTLSPFLARWNGSAWSSMGLTEYAPHVGYTRAVAQLSGGDIIAAGNFAITGVTPVFLARLSSGQWTALEDIAVNSLSPTGDGGFFAGGTFTSIGSLHAYGVAHWAAGAWDRLGSGTDGKVNALAILHNGDLVVGGSFTTFAGVAANHIARWDGTAWYPLGLGT